MTKEGVLKIILKGGGCCDLSISKEDNFNMQRCVASVRAGGYLMFQRVNAAEVYIPAENIQCMVFVTNPEEAGVDMDFPGKSEGRMN